MKEIIQKNMVEEYGRRFSLADFFSFDIAPHVSLVRFESGETILVQGCCNGITAITPCTCYRIRTNECRDELLRDVRFLRCLCLFLGQKAIGNTYNYSKNQSYPLKVRLAGFILMTSHNGYYREKHTEVSEYLGVTYRHLLYVLADFVKRELLRKTDAGYFISNRLALQKIALFHTPK